MLPEMICHVQRWMKRLHECASRGYFGERKRNYEYHFNLDVHAVINTLHDTNRVEDKEKRIFKFIGEMPRWTSSGLKLHPKSELVPIVRIRKRERRDMCIICIRPMAKSGTSTASRRRRKIQNRIAWRMAP